MSYIIKGMRDSLQDVTGSSENNIMALWALYFDQKGIAEGSFTVRWRAYLEQEDETTYRSITEALRGHYGQYSSANALTAILREAFESVYYDLAGAEDNYILADSTKYNIEGV